MYYYAVVDIKDIVQYIDVLEEEVDFSDYVPIATEDYTLVGKWYDRYGKYGTVGAFLEPPISVLAEHSTTQISYKDQDVWLDEKLDSYATTSSVQSALNNYSLSSHTHNVATTSKNGFLSSTDKSKLDGIEYNANNYTHPESHPASMITETDSLKIMTATERTKLSGIAENANNYVHPSTHSIGIIEESSTKKIMTADERTKLSGIEANANNYVHPTEHPASMITGLSSVATSGSYTDLSDKPEIPEAYVHPDTHPASMISGLSGVATSGSYEDLTNKPTIPSAYTHPDTHPASMISGLADVATSGSYEDLANKPSSFTPSAHTHTQSEITGLSTALNSKANSSHTHAQSEISGLESALSGKASSSHVHDSATSTTAGFMSKDDKAKLDGISANANNYSHPSSHPASMISGLASVATSGSYEDLDDKPTIPSAYTHPTTHPASMITGLSSVATSGSYNDLSDKPSSFTPSSHTHAQSEITGLSTALSGKASSSHTHTSATTTAAGFMSKDDKAKLDGISANANNYSHPSSHPASMITGLASIATSGSYNDLSNKPSTFTPSSHTHAQSEITGLESALSGKASSSHTHASATTTTAGFMSKDDKAKLDGIATNANNYSHPSTHPASMITGLSTVATSGSYADLSNKPSTFTPSSHTHAQSEISGLSSALSAKANSSHSHAQSDISGLTTALNNKAPLHSVEVTETGTNLNNYTTAGMYSFSVASAPLNMPSGCTNGWLVVIPWCSGSNTIKQFFLRHGTPNSTDHCTYTRLYTSESGWSNWSTFYTTSNPPTAADVGATPAFTNSTGGVEYSFGSGSGKNLLTEISSWSQGFHTAYSIGDTSGNPKTTESWRIFVHKTSETIGWIMAYGSSGSIYANYQNAANSFTGWRCVYENTNKNILWTGSSYLSSSDGTPQTVTPSKKLSECRTGWILLWSDYDPGSGANDIDFVTTFIPKYNPSGGTWGGKAFLCSIPTYVGGDANDISTEIRVIKPIYVHDDCIKGSYQNTSGGRNDVVLRAVYEF